MQADELFLSIGAVFLSFLQEALGTLLDTLYSFIALYSSLLFPILWWSAVVVVFTLFLVSYLDLKWEWGSQILLLLSPPTWAVFWPILVFIFFLSNALVWARFLWQFPRNCATVARVNQKEVKP